MRWIYWIFGMNQKGEKRKWPKNVNIFKEQKGREEG